MRKFQNPPKEYRPVPFWSWNDKLEPDFLKWQIQEMNKAGLGGYFMHARSGIETKYLSGEWMECIKAGIDEGKQTEMNSWIYDEAGWPSGFAGGIVTALGDKYHARGLRIQIVDDPKDICIESNTLGVYKLNMVTKEITFLNIDVADISKEDNEQLIIMRHTSSPYYIDVLNEKVVSKFLEVTHEKYYSLYGEECGTGIQGFFTDEPRLSEGDVPWSYILLEKFTEKYGYNLLEVLPALFIKSKGFGKVRYDFWNLVSELFVVSFMKQIYEWCEAHNCKLTGHLMMEESLYSQMTGTAGVMPFYEYMQVPGIDWLRRTINSPVVPKQVGSVANQLGKKAVLTESYALCGWDVNFEELKWIAEWQFVNGVNLMCQHLEGYTLRGLRKRDYPPSLFFQQSWWEEYKFFNDYLARLGVLLTEGKNAVNILMLHPMRSGWVSYDGTNNEVIADLDRDFIKASEILSGMHMDYHYGDETIISRHGRIDVNKFIVGQCEYNTVILPSMLTIDEGTFNLLNELIDNGGKVISIGNFPTLINGNEDKRMGLLKGKILQTDGDKEVLYNALRESQAYTISIVENGVEIEEIHYQQRDLGDSSAFFMVNHDAKKAFKAVITLKGKGRVRRLSAENGVIQDVEYSQIEAGTEINLEFLPMQSHIIIFENKESDEFAEADFKSIEVRPDKQWKVEEADLNSLTLDYCSYNIDNEGWNAPMPVIKLMDMLLNMRRSCDIALKFNFNLDMDLKKNKEFYLVLEDADKFEMILNGNRLEYRDLGWWKDSAFRKVDIKPYIKKGVNEVVLKRRFYQAPKVYEVLFGKNVYETELNKLTYDVELESIYLVGDFGVVSESEYSYGERKAIFTKGPFKIIDKPEVVSSGDLTEQGFNFFAGAIKLSQNIILNKENDRRVILNIGKPNAPLTKIYINEKPAKLISWAPYEADITDYVVQGENKITIQLFASNRNLLGPHHHINGELHSVGPVSFTGKWSWCDRSSEAVVVDKKDREKNYWREGYCFVLFGLRASETEGNTTSALRENELLSNVKKYIDDNMKKNISLEMVADNFNLSYYSLSKNFKVYTGRCFIDYITRIRIQRAKELLRRTKLKVKEIANEIGYENVVTFIRNFNKYEGTSPGEFRKKILNI
jgi:AraC-like DNA-binding protein